MTKKSRLVGFALCAVAAAFGVHYAIRSARQSAPITGHVTKTGGAPATLVRSYRPNYPYSVIPGGMYSTREFTFADGKDPVVRAHYADFNLKEAKLVQLNEDRFQYVSYRVKNQVYWTNKKLRIPKGELLWSDGSSFARARCGNRLSAKPLQPTNPNAPSEALLSMPPVRPDLLGKLSFVEAPALTQTAPPEVLPNESSRTAALPGDPEVQTHADKPWGDGPITYPVGSPVAGFAGLGSPLAPSAGGGSTTTASAAKSSTTPTVTGTPTTPIDATPPPAVSPVPEPGRSLYIFLFALLISLWAIYRLSIRDDASHPTIKSD